MKRFDFKLSSVVEEIIFGVEDSLVSTLGALTGIAAGTQSTYVVVLSGVVLIFAEGFSMAAGSYLSSKYERDVWLEEHAGDWDKLLSVGRGHLVARALEREDISDDSTVVILDAVELQRRRWLRQVIEHEKASSPSAGNMPIVSAVVMGVCYLSAGIIPLGAYFVLPVSYAVLPSIVVTALALFGFGAWSSRFVNRKWYIAAMEMTIVAFGAASVGYVLGLIVRFLFGVVV